MFEEIVGFAESPHADYMRREWSLFLQNPARAEASLAATAGRGVRRVLDVGCGAGQELLPFAKGSALAVGVDIEQEAGHLARALFQELGLGSPALFVRSTGEQLPFPDDCFDVVICRIALPYMDTALALREMVRVLRPGGVLLLKIHHARYYLRQLIRAVPSANLRSFVHASRVLVSGVLFHVLGHQIRRKPVGPETFQTLWLLRRLLPLRMRGHLPDSNPHTPSLLFEKPGPLFDPSGLVT